MQAVINEFINGVREKQHLINFINNSFLNITISTKDEKVQILIDHGDVTLLCSTDETKPDVEIIGMNETIIESILLGKIKLRDALREKQINIQASYRLTLFLETLFALSKGY